MSQKKRRIVPGVALVALVAAAGLLLLTAGGAFARAKKYLQILAFETILKRARPCERSRGFESHPRRSDGSTVS